MRLQMYQCAHYKWPACGVERLRSLLAAVDLFRFINFVCGTLYLFIYVHANTLLIVKTYDGVSLEHFIVFIRNFIIFTDWLLDAYKVERTCTKHVNSSLSFIKSAAPNMRKKSGATCFPFLWLIDWCSSKDFYSINGRQSMDTSWYWTQTEVSKEAA